jgi:thiol-disulfide isomerase/thioredoxin
LTPATARAGRIIMTVIGKELYDSGSTYTEFRDRILGTEGIMNDLLTASEAHLASQTLNVDTFKALDKPVRVLVLSEDWCGDCTDNLPVLNRIAQDTGKLDFRIVSRDENLDIQNQYLKYGKFQSVPTMLFLDDDGTVFGHFIERPESVTELRAAKRQAIYDAHPEFGTPGNYQELSDEARAALQEALKGIRDETREFANSEVVRELSEIAASRP